MNERFGWVQGSTQAATYVHLSGRQVDDSVLRVYGLKKGPGSDGSKLVPKACPRCRRDNDSTAKFCAYCGMALDHRAVSEAEEELNEWNDRMTKLVQDPEVQTLLVKKLREMDGQGPA